MIDSPSAIKKDNQYLIASQKNIISHAYADEPDFKFTTLNKYEQILVYLISHDKANGCYLRDYIFDMLLGLEFDANRRHIISSQQSLDKYSQRLGRAYTNVLQVFSKPAKNFPQVTNQGFLAGYASHLAHILRDFYEDISLGYYNISKEELDKFNWLPKQLPNVDLRPWVYEKVQKTYTAFSDGLNDFKNSDSIRFRFLGYSISARYIYILEKIKQNDFGLLKSYTPTKREKLIILLWTLKSTYIRSFDPTLLTDSSSTSNILIN